MSDLISREATIQALNDYLRGKPMYEDYPWQIIEVVQSVPSAEKTGEWIDHQLDRWVYAKCSECGSVHNVRSNYCPNCGARMEQ